MFYMLNNRKGGNEVRELGDLLIRLRGTLSLREAAKRSGLSYSYISSLEKGKHPRTGAPINPTPEILRNLAKAYNHPYDELMKLAGYSDNKEDPSIEVGKKEVLDRIDKEIFEEIVKLNIKQKEKLKKLMEIVKEE